MSKIYTSFSTIYDNFLTRVTSDMYMEWTELDTYSHLQDLLTVSIPRFEFPRFNIFDYEEGYYDSLGTYKGVESNNIEVPAAGWVGGTFHNKLTLEEINIIALNMVIEWLGQQLSTTDNTVMKYSGSDFKFASQANHMAKIKNLLEKYEQESNHLQKLYKRRIVDKDGSIKTTIPTLMMPFSSPEEERMKGVFFNGYEIRH